MTSESHLIDHLPPQLKDARTWKLSGGLSGAGVYGVEKAGVRYVLKFTTTAPLLELVSEAGVAPRVIHRDAETVLCEFIEGKQWIMFFMTDPGRAIDELGRLLAKVHALPIPATMQAQSKKWFLDSVTEQLGAWPRPAWFRDRVDEVRALEVPDGGPDVLSHNDVNPSNLIWDGTRILLLDWDVAAPNDRYYDLAAVSLFFRFDEARCLRLVSAHDGEAVTILPARFVYDRKLVGAMIGSIFMKLAREGGHPGDANAPAPELAEVYGMMREGKLDPATAIGQFTLGLALLAQSRS